MSRFSRKTYVLLFLAILAVIAMTFSDTLTASAQVASRHTTATTSTPPAPAGVDTNDKNAPDPSKDHIVYATRGSKVNPNLVNNCGWVTCSLYFSRWQTTEIALWGPVVVLNLGWVPGWVGFILKLGAAFIQARAQVASSFNACLRIRYTVGFAIVGVYVDQSGFCHDN
jgi:hypothetical protein